MKFLILGGTQFVGRHITETALANGHEVTLFNRGKTNADLFPDVEKLQGDRDGDLESLRGKTWDAVLDINGYVPRIVRDTAELLKDSVGRYMFISTISVFTMPVEPNADENAPLQTLEDESTEAVTGETYGALKVLCERVVEEIYGDRALIIRPGLVVGPNDPTDRFTYYPARAAKGGEMLAPGDGSSPIQFIDARDLAAWTVRMVESGGSGIYNATGPDRPQTFRDVYEACQRAVDNDLQVTWVDEKFLLEHEVSPWADLPLWLPDEMSALHRINVSKATTAGLAYRSLDTIVHDTLTWEQSRPADAPRRGGALTPEREAELLRAWHETTGN